MQYMGGKFRIAKHIGPIIAESAARTGSFFEPFLGGNNFYHAVAPIARAELSDIDQSLITLYQSFVDGWRPADTLSKEEWQVLKTADDPHNPMTAFAAYGCSWGGKRWSSYAWNKTGSNYARGSLHSLERTVKPARYVHRSYSDLEPRSGTIYCDPPYRNTTGYSFGPFDYEQFYDWCRVNSRRGVDVFVSEYEMPEDFACVFERKQRNNMTKKVDVRVEKLFLCRAT